MAQRVNCFGVVNVHMVNDTSVMIFCTKTKKRHGRWHMNDGLRWSGRYDGVDGPLSMETDVNLSRRSHCYMDRRSRSRSERDER